MKAWILTLITLLAVSPTMAEPLVYEGTEGIGKGKHIVFIANDHEYRSEQTCPLLAKILAKHHGFRCTVLFGVDQQGTIKPGARAVPGMEALADADMLFFFTRFMNLPDEQADRLVDYFESGGPVVGVRTSTHCFNGQQGKWAKLNFNYSGDDYHGGLGEQVFGNTWEKERGQSHYGSNHQMGSRITAVAGAENHPILTGVDQIHAYSGAYKSHPPADAVELLQVQVLNTFGPSEDINTEKPLVNAGWTRDSYTAPSGEKKDARVVYTSFGASEDLLSEDGRRFLVNACLWACGLEDTIKPNLDVSIVGEYAPSPYTNGAFYYEGVKPLDLAGWDSRVMPDSAPLAAVGEAKNARKQLRILDNRPELKAQLAEQYPDLYGPDAKLPPAPPRKKNR
ncbi:Trehalose utilization [Stieleria maiorica]|uniref:Trehalose utilization n=1 Tax=Stieleria maiorica TaxID=2795974 RepID=A0A5B9MAP8_9BACT|nr:ThuA domain-containing protein [Stieleria maiorica]QEF98218.1 Trehalose utilization [Stieleria maiorica]